MSSDLSNRSDEENQRNLERFSPLMYQLKKSTGASGQTHSMKCDIIGQEPGYYAYPSGDKRSSPNDAEDTEAAPSDIPSSIENGTCFKPKKLL